LKEYVTIITDSIAHDDGCGDICEKQCHLVVRGLEGVSLVGTVLEDGRPGTVLAGDGAEAPDTLLPSILWVESSEGLSLRNLAFTRDPETASAGVVRSVRDDTVQVEVFQGLPCHDRMGAYCMNRFRLQERRLMGASLTYGFGFDTRFRQVGSRLLELTDRTVAQSVSKGDGLSWHQSGRTDFQLFFGDCTGLVFDNVRVYNTNSFAILTEDCRDIVANRLILKPRGNQFFTGPRDGWKIYRCTGRISLMDCHIEGVRMDGQNVHSNFMTVEEVPDPYTVLCSCRYAPTPLTSGTVMEIYDGARIVERIITSWKVVGRAEIVKAVTMPDSAGAVVPGRPNLSTRYLLTFEERLEPFTGKGTLMTPRCWEPESYICRDSDFLNIAGAGQLLRVGDVVIEGCTYRNVMNAGILMGAERDVHGEGGHAVNVAITECLFENCGFRPRYGKMGAACIAVTSQGFHEPLNRKIRIEGNRFRNSEVAVEVRDAGDVLIRDNHYENIGIPHLIELETTEGIRIEELETTEGIRMDR
ncbi:MAG TPA: right-handed parallel beta-helix repeat-containing protein, partial [Clostridiaceae bacterium]|nr:right-handed parallel beta-helix repeat-containing protein [Clostridiaceae bacterium]